MAAVSESSYEEGREYVCRWPNGEVQRVMLTKILEQLPDGAEGCDPADAPFGQVIWNEQMNPDDEDPSVLGMDATVPLSWLSPVDPSAPAGLESA